MSDNDEDTPWFVRPLEPDDDDDADARAPLTADLDARRADWAAAESAEIAAIARVGHLLGRLDERLRMGAPAGRLIPGQAADLLWTDGRTVRPERLAHVALDGASVATRGPEYRLGLWVMRRLEWRGRVGDAESLRRFLGWRRRDEAEGPGDGAESAIDMAIERDAPEEADAAIARWFELRAALSDRHPVTRGAALAHAWAFSGARSPDQAVSAALLGSRMSVAPSEAGGLVHAPAALRFRRGAPGEGEDRVRRNLVAWLEAVETGATKALLELNRLEIWRRRAEDFARGRQGGTPMRVVEAFYGDAVLSAWMLSETIGVSRNTAERQIAAFEAAGLLNEITHAAQWRFWTAAL